MAAPAIIPLVQQDLPALFVYLDDHLGDNGRDGTPLFQPMPRAESFFPIEKRAGFVLGLGTALDAPGWRRGWIAVDGGGAICGHIDVRARPERTAAHRCLLGMGVHRDHRAQGLGARLLDTALAWADAQGLAWVDLEVLSNNFPARRLYEHSGFVQTGEIADLFRIDGEQHGYVFMTRRV